MSFLLVFLPQAATFGILPSVSVHGISEMVAAHANLLSPVLFQGLLLPLTIIDPSSSTVVEAATTVLQAATPEDQAIMSASFLVSSYTQALVAHPLWTKISTGMVLAVGGDGTAQYASQLQQQEGNDKGMTYDSKRAAAFCAFDGCYRAVQHVTYPPMIEACRGEFLLGALRLLPTVGNDPSSSLWLPSAAAAMEQTLVSQLIIIPLLYYPVFYAVTGFVQGLTPSETLQRAKQTFVPLMKRNLLFWIPVQFFVFVFVSDMQLQIPILSVCGLIWTMILSGFAGAVSSSDTVSKMEESVRDVQADSSKSAIASVINGIADGEEQCVMEEEVYCVTGMEENCLIDPDDLFRPAVTVQCPGDEEKAFLPSAGR